MNYLALCNRLKRECGVSGSAMATVVGQAEDYARLIDWISTAWMDIQMMHEDWQFMRSSASWITVAGQATYTPAQCGVTNLGAWDRATFRSYTTSVGQNSEIYLPYRDYEDWRDVYQFGATRVTQSQPIEMTITPAKSIGLGPVPSAGYTVTGDYFTVPTELTLDADTPSLPTQFHMLIVYRAMMHYGSFEAAGEVYQRGLAEFNKMMRRLTASRMPEVILGGALA